MSNYFSIVRAWLASVDPAAPAATLVLTVFFAIYALRRWFPSAWLWLEHRLPFVGTLDYRPVATVVSKFVQALPGALLGAVVASLSSGASVKNAVFGVLAGFGASLVHEVMAAYKGEVSAPKPFSDPMGPMGGVLALGLVFSLTGCAIFGAHGSFWPALEHCAPSPASLVSQVEDILLAGGDYEAALKSKALQDGAGIVECAVASAVDLLSAKAGKIGASPESAPAAARGKMFLAKVSAQ